MLKKWKGEYLWRLCLKRVFFLIIAAQHTPDPRRQAAAKRPRCRFILHRPRRHGHKNRFHWMVWKGVLPCCFFIGVAPTATFLVLKCQLSWFQISENWSPLPWCVLEHIKVIQYHWNTASCMCNRAVINQLFIHSFIQYLHNVYSSIYIYM